MHFNVKMHFQSVLCLLIQIHHLPLMFHCCWPQRWTRPMTKILIVLAIYAWYSSGWIGIYFDPELFGEPNNNSPLNGPAATVCTWKPMPSQSRIRWCASPVTDLYWKCACTTQGKRSSLLPFLELHQFLQLSQVSSRATMRTCLRSWFTRASSNLCDNDLQRALESGGLVPACK